MQTASLSQPPCYDYASKKITFFTVLTLVIDNLYIFPVLVKYRLSIPQTAAEKELAV